MNTSSTNKEPARRIALLFMVRYPTWAIFFGFLSMAFFRLPLWLNRKLLFWKLMGSGRNGSFDMMPDLSQWSILIVLPLESGQQSVSIDNVNTLITKYLGVFVSKWINLFNAHTHAFLLIPEVAHGSWNGKLAFGQLPRQVPAWTGSIVVLTRATIRLRKAAAFWKNVDNVSKEMAVAPGFVCSYGIGEAPFLRQATFSLWESREAMTSFAFKMPEHNRVIKKTHAEKWYSEEMFTRFKLVKVWNRPDLDQWASFEALPAEQPPQQ